MDLFCSDWLLTPMSAESAFCVVSTSTSGKDQRLLERDARWLVRATDAYARRYKTDFKVKQLPEIDRLILPVVVTNAKLFVAEYNPSDVSLETGQLPTPSPAKLSAVQWVRFRKAFSSAGRDVGDRTVFIVSAPALTTWLGKLGFAGSRTASEDSKVHVQ